MSTGEVEKRPIFATGCKIGVFLLLSGVFLVGAIKVGNRLELKFGPSVTSLALAGDLDMVKHVLDLGADASAPDSRGFIPLEAAMFSRNIVRDMIVKKLLEYGADQTAKGHYGLTPIQLAASSKLYTTVGCLRDAGGEFTIVEAIYLGDAEAAEDLLKEDPESVNRRTDARPYLYNILGRETELTPLHIAAARGERDIVKILLEHGADMDALNRHGHTPLHYAILFSFFCNTSEVTLFLLGKGADVNARDALGRTALHLYAAQIFGANKRSADIVNAFVEQGADAHVKDNEGRSPIEVASSTALFRRRDLLTAAFERHPSL